MLLSLVFCAVFAWEAYEHGTDLHPNVDPTKLELMYKEFKDKKENFKSDQQKSILEKVCVVCVRACVRGCVEWGRRYQQNHQWTTVKSVGSQMCIAIGLCNPSQ